MGGTNNHPSSTNAKETETTSSEDNGSISINNDSITEGEEGKTNHIIKPEDLPSETNTSNNNNDFDHNSDKEEMSIDSTSTVDKDENEEEKDEYVEEDSYDEKQEILPPVSEKDSEEFKTNDSDNIQTEKEDTDEYEEKKGKDEGKSDSNTDISNGGTIDNVTHDVTSSQQQQQQQQTEQKKHQPAWDDNDKGFSGGGILLFFIILGLGGGVYYKYHKNKDKVLGLFNIGGNITLGESVAAVVSGGVTKSTKYEQVAPDEGEDEDDEEWGWGNDNNDDGKEDIEMTAPSFVNQSSYNDYNITQRRPSFDNEKKYYS